MKLRVMKSKGQQERPVEFVSVGHLAVDLHNGSRVLGGAAAYSSLAASRLGLSTAVVSAVSHNFDLFESLNGIEVHYAPSSESTTFKNIYEGETRRQWLLGRAQTLVEETLSPLKHRLADDAIVLFCPIAREISFPFRKLAPKGLCGVAPQGCFRHWDDEGRVKSTTWKDAAAHLSQVDVLSLSIDDPPDPDAFQDQTNGHVPLFAMTYGERGARVFFDGQGYHVPAFPRPTFDPTGAGDVFAASLLVGLREGMVPLEAAQFACCSASFAVEQAGVAGMPPSRDAVEERLAIYRSRFAPKELSS